jgi:hypothetical protein
MEEGGMAGPSSPFVTPRAPFALQAAVPDPRFTRTPSDFDHTGMGQRASLALRRELNEKKVQYAGKAL